MRIHLLTPDPAFDPNTQAVAACLTAGLDDELRDAGLAPAVR
jgi:hypothetical protein